MYTTYSHIVLSYNWINPLKFMAYVSMKKIKINAERSECTKNNSSRSFFLYATLRKVLQISNDIYSHSDSLKVNIWIFLNRLIFSFLVVGNSCWRICFSDFMSNQFNHFSSFNRWEFSHWQFNHFFFFNRIKFVEWN